MIGTQIEQYRIVQKLGEGGMGTVYKAVDLNLDRLVAIKLLNSDLAQRPELLARFRSEARVQATLNHPNAATLYAFLVWQGTPVMVMEFVEGETLQSMVARCGPIPSQTAIPLFKQALLGIGAAHRCGIVHRDIKPANIMLSKDGCIKVMDFGIAKVIGVTGSTRTNVQMGTAWYMAPEQVLNRQVDARTDVYSLGVTLYELLSGRVPFDGPSEYEIQRAHVQMEPPSPALYYPHIPAAAVAAVLKALSKDAGQRFGSAEEFAAALDAPVQATPPPPPRKTPAPPPPPAPAPVAEPVRIPFVWTKRNKQVAAGAGALAAVVGLGVWALSNNAEREWERERDRVVQAQQEAERSRQAAMELDRGRRLESEQRRSVEELVERVKREAADTEKRMSPVPEPPAVMPSNPMPPNPVAANPISGVWRGVLSCPGNIPVQFAIQAKSPQDVSAKVQYWAPAGRTGSYFTRGAFSPSTNRLTLTFTSWEHRPANTYRPPPGFEGVLQAYAGTISGTVLAPGCKGFTVRRQ